MIYLSSFALSDKKVKNPNLYPYSVFQDKDCAPFVFAPITILYGDNGCGKSTLLNIIAGLDTPTSGAVYIDGKKIEGTGTERGVVFQQYALFPWLTVLKNVMFGLKLQGKSDA